MKKEFSSGNTKRKGEPLAKWLGTLSDKSQRYIGNLPGT